ncbi:MULTISPECIES: hypothetical protein [unclassified Bradyrhizobium]|uniref:hypothetical protein n=1 Tax=unclassified Bradyrhizobium TaxID=2631580 RepID=UPI0028E88664|nr:MULTISPECIES: hypothetical protein [unclassified Bradyrhizobium]
MTQCTSPSRIIQLTLAAAVLMPTTAFAESPLTARQMLAHAQSQALNIPDEVKKPEPNRNDRKSGEAVVAPSGASAIAPPLPVIEPPAPISPQPTTLSALTVPVARPEPASPQTRTNSLTAAAPSVDAAPATTSVATTAGTPGVAPTTPPVAAAASPAAAPAVGPAAATAQPSLPITIAAPTQQVQAVAPSSSSAARPADARRASKAAAPSRTVHKSSPRSSLRNDDAAIGNRISHIMRRPEVQALMSQYGLE